MVMLHGQDLTAQQIAARTGRLSQVGGVRLVTVSDGAGRGVRLLQFETGAGLRFAVAVDRAMDIVELSWNGLSIGWHSAMGLRAPGLDPYDAEDGLGWNRSFTGFLATCGLDHILGPEEVPADTYSYPRRARVRHGLHGRINGTPARLTGYGEHWRDGACVLWAEGVVEQATLFGEVLHLHRRIEADLAGHTVRLRDRVVNAGFSVTPHMMMYHVNLGYPLLDAGSRYLAALRGTIWAGHDLAAQGVGYRTCPPPVPGFSEQVWQHDLAAAPDGTVAVAVVNDRLGLGLRMTTRSDQFPCAYQWQNFAAGNYVMGIEPSTHHVLGNGFARERREMIWLSAGEERTYQADFDVLTDAAAIAAAEARIAAVAPPPETEFPMPTGRFPSLRPAIGTP